MSTSAGVGAETDGCMGLRESEGSVMLKQLFELSAGPVYSDERSYTP
jgi:hypothetical protein